MQPPPDGIWGLPVDKLAELPGYDPDIVDIAEIISSDYPGELLVVCRNPLLAEGWVRRPAELRSWRRSSRALQPACAGHALLRQQSGSSIVRYRR
jgi:hypothetical protein